ncbi:MAG: transposase [Sphingomonadaceae bacterium]
MSDAWLLSEAQMQRIEPFFLLSHGVPRVDDRRVISGIIYVLQNGLGWRGVRAASLLKKGLFPDLSAAPKAA